MKTCKHVKTKGLISIVLLITIAWNCENVKDWSDPEDNTKPEKVTAVEVENLHGGAMITYTLPPDPDKKLLGVKAVYSLREGGQEYEIFSSAFRDTVILIGFPDTNERRVNLYTITKSRVASEPVSVIIKPLTPPVELVRQSLKMDATFGGVHCSWENIMNENIAISLYVDSIGEMTLDDTYFSNASKAGHSFRGFPNNEILCRIVIRDRWMNYAMPLDTVITPLFERQITGRNDLGIQQWFLWGFINRECLSRGDNWRTLGTNSDITVLFDNILFDGGNWWYNGDDAGYLRHYVPGWSTIDNTYGYPAYMSFDLSKESFFSRFKVYMRARSPLFSANIFTKFELWGTNNPKPLVSESTDEDRLTNLRYWTAWPEIGGTDEWKNDWVQLGDYSLVLPSGATMTSDIITSEDEQFIRNGFEFIIDLDKNSIPCRYVRFVIKGTNYAGLRPGVQMGELQFFGSYAN